MNTITLLFFGDIVGRPGQRLFAKWALDIKKRFKADLVIVNGENSAQNGRGITKPIVNRLKEAGADVITTGNHVWAQRDSYQLFDERDDVLRPLNFPSSCPGKGHTLVRNVGEHNSTVAIVNVQGRVFMHENVGCPFRELESTLTYLKMQTKLIFVDFHAETTSEKQGMAYYFDGKISGLYGTHTHVQTADERILPGGTSFISDLGFAGALNSMLGMKKEPILHRMLTQMPAKFAVDETGPFAIHGIAVTVDADTGKSVKIERFVQHDDELVVGKSA